MTGSEKVLNRRSRRSQSYFQILCALCVLLLNSAHSFARTDVVKAELDKETAWTGEPVNLIVTLYSPGPFSGTAAFELPKLSRTAIMKIGNPVVGSEEIEGESYLIQRHQFRVYTQLNGEITIPSFKVRFAGKPDFTSDAIDQEGSTPRLKFESKRPPGTESLGVVVAVAEMEVSQSWLPENQTSFTAGDVIQRVIVRQADGTTAMMLPPAPLDAPDGVRVYGSDPVVQDQTDRGEFIARRDETIKYQFENAGTFDLPTIEFVRWDPQKEELVRESLAGLTVDVAPAPGESATDSFATTSENRSTWNFVFWLTLFLFIAAVGWKLVSRWLIAWNEKRNRPESIAAKQVIQACRSNDSAGAYSAILSWERASASTSTNKARSRELDKEVELLSRNLFGAHTDSPTWSGQNLLVVFRKARKAKLQVSAASAEKSALPALNP